MFTETKDESDGLCIRNGPIASAWMDRNAALTNSAVKQPNVNLTNKFVNYKN